MTEVFARSMPIWVSVTPHSGVAKRLIISIGTAS